MARRIADLEMYAEIDPRVTLLKDLREGRETARRSADWGTRQLDRSWPERSMGRPAVEHTPVGEVRRESLSWMLVAAGLLATGIVVAGFVTIGIEKGLL
ncbi:MAG TPA: hypothetical protein VIY90_13350 [Steroidobacteraceae bacterium]